MFRTKCTQFKSFALPTMQIFSVFNQKVFFSYRIFIMYVENKKLLY